MLLRCADVGVWSLPRLGVYLRSARSKIAIRHTLAAVSIGCLVCGSLVHSLIAFDHVKTGYDSLADETVPNITDAAQIARISQAIVSTAPQLAVAGTNQARLTVQNRLQDHLRDLDQVFEGLAACPSARWQECRDTIAVIDEQRSALVANLAVLNETVEQILEISAAAEQNIDQLNAAVAAAIAARHAIDAEAGGISDANSWPGRAHRWIDDTQTVFHDLLTLSRLRNEALVRQAMRRIEPAARDLLARQPISAAHPQSPLLDPIHADLVSLIDPQAGLAAQVQAQIDMSRRVAGLVGQNTRLANRFVGGIANLTAILEQHTLAQRDEFAGLLAQAFFISSAVAAATLLWLAGLALSLRRSVVRRLHQLRDSMLAQVSGRDVPIPTDGSDEISEIGDAARFFLNGIAEREARLMAAKETAERLADEAEIANSAKSQFLANMSHELRTPLNSIIGFSDLLKMGVGESDRVVEYARFINQSGAHLLGLINEILDLSQIETGQKTLTMVEVSPIELLRTLEPLVRLQYQKRNLELVIRVRPDVRVEADERAFRQVFVNLLSNAGKFAHRETVVEITDQVKADRLYLTVRDRGVGIAETNLKRVLEPFQQEDDASCRRAEGTGLGLSIVAALVRMHGGSVDLRSEKSVGTEVTVSFPLAGSRTSAANDDKAPARPCPHRTKPDVA